MLYIISKFPNYRSQWVYRYTYKIKQVLISRHVEFMEVDNAENAIALCKNENDVILIPNNISAKVLQMVKKCNEANIQVILPNGFLNVGEPLRYHSICGDIFDVVKRIMDTFRSTEKKRVALCGANPYSQSDVLLVDAFISLYSSPKSVFFNTDTSNDSINKFLESDEYDAVICANDYIALALIKVLQKDNPEYLKKLSIISFSNTILARISSMPITSCQPNIFQVGNAVADIYQVLTKRKGSCYSAITAYVPYQIYERETTGDLRFFNKISDYGDNENLSFQVAAADNFLTMDDIALYWNVDWCLNQLTAKNFLVLIEILRGCNRKQICENLFISFDTVNYHLRKLRSIFQVNTTKQLVDLLKPLISLETIEKNQNSLDKNLLDDFVK